MSGIFGGHSMVSAIELGEYLEKARQQLHPICYPKNGEIDACRVSIATMKRNLRKAIAALDRIDFDIRHAHD